MSDRPILPKPSEVVAPGITALTALRPGALKHINSGQGRWSHVTEIVKAQSSLALSYLADEVKQARLPFASGKGLVDLVSSEFNAPLTLGPTYAIGEVYLTRSGTSAGVIPKGAKFKKNPNPTAVPIPIEAAEYEVSETCVWNTGETAKAVKIKATRPGPHANTPNENVVDGAPNNIVPVTQLFDTFYPSYGLAAGGSLGISDKDLRILGAAYARGQYGPTQKAILAGTFLAGARRAFVADNLSTATTVIVPVDESWATSPSFENSVKQYIADNFAGFGAGKLSVWDVLNNYVTVEATIQLRASNLLSYTDEISANAANAVRAYFDDRADWYVWKRSAIRGVIARSDRRILTCTSVTIKDRFGDTVNDSSYTTTGSLVVHNYMISNAFRPTFTGPA